MADLDKALRAIVNEQRRCAAELRCVRQLLEQFATHLGLSPPEGYSPPPPPDRAPTG